MLLLLSVFICETDMMPRVPPNISVRAMWMQRGKERGRGGRERREGGRGGRERREGERSE